ncbi:MAG: hypothetical protein KGL39_17505 [Patescibacteria group bacterium]|nr:hypothetical protein [Patescibacteria group bacterium]
MANWLRRLQINESSVVDAPANPGARMPLFKRDTKGGENVDEPRKTENGVEFPASDYAHVPDKHHPSTWKLRLTSEPGGKPDARHVGAAIAAISPEGYRGERAEIPEAAMGSVKERLRGAWKEANPDKDEADMPEHIQKAFGEGGSTTATTKGDKTWPTGTHVSWHYRSAIGRGVIDGIAEHAETHDDTKYRIRESDHHPGEPDIVEHYGRALTKAEEEKEALAKAAGNGARSYAEVSADTQTDDRQFQMIWDLREAIDSIMDDATVPNKSRSISETLNQFEADLQPLIIQMNAAQQQGVKKFIAEIRQKGAKSNVGDPNVNHPQTDVEKAALEKRLADAEARAQAAEEVAKAERGERLTRDAIQKAQSYDRLALNPEEFGAVLKSLREKAPEDAAKVEAILDAANAAVAKGALYAEIGAAGAGPTDAEGKIEKAAEEVRKNNPSLTKEQAFSKALSEHPELYAEYRRQSA